MDRLSPRDWLQIAVPASGRASRSGGASMRGEDDVDHTPADRVLVAGHRMSSEAFRLFAKARLRLESRRARIQERT